MRKKTGIRKPGALLIVPASLVVCLVTMGCPDPLPPVNGLSNTTDPTNAGASHIGGAACQACHPGFGERHALHGHAHILISASEAAIEAQQPGAPVPPPGVAWGDLSFRIGGFTKGAAFVDREGFLLVDGATEAPIMFQLERPVSGVEAGLQPFAGIAHAPYRHDCFRCHTTGSRDLAASGGLRQENRPGIEGTWAQNGVQCEACHGPGSRHVATQARGTIFIDPRGDTCISCHSMDADLDRLHAGGGFILGGQQAAEVAASPHAGFTCMVCHNPHSSIVQDRPNAVRNACQACHADQNMALHAGRIYVLGDHVEPLSCESCHMPYASSYVSAATPEFTDTADPLIGDTRTHIMLIDTLRRPSSAMFTADGTEVVKDAAGRAAVTVDMVCLRCHHGQGNAFRLDLAGASTIGSGIHGPR